ncbi:hypothetical protein WN55_07693 [Dufourea novaeangliae]|uniref:Uncharacterized protein n=1 Tax=Dufourea novaeangliae TaxID=178035 RepID=A0A154P601_DUFNO|nr:hypothetical protein WN55_07693 [Dufourea novaeangliae]
MGVVVGVHSLRHGGHSQGFRHGGYSHGRGCVGQLSRLGVRQMSRLGVGQLSGQHTGVGGGQKGGEGDELRNRNYSAFVRTNIYYGSR